MHKEQQSTLYSFGYKQKSMHIMAANNLVYRKRLYVMFTAWSTFDIVADANLATVQVCMVLKNVIIQDNSYATRRRLNCLRQVLYKQLGHIINDRYFRNALSDITTKRRKLVL